MKKTIVLNESDLHRIISESVKRILNEMEPTTYASYAQKRAEQANGQRQLSQSQQRRNLSPEQMQQQVQQGRDAAVNSWNKKYGFRNPGEFGDNSYTMIPSKSDSTEKQYYNTEYYPQDDGWGAKPYEKYHSSNEEGGDVHARNTYGHEAWVPVNPKSTTKRMPKGDIEAYMMTYPDRAQFNRETGEWECKE